MSLANYCPKYWILFALVNIYHYYWITLKALNMPC